MKFIYFDICAIPLFILALWTCYARKMTRGHANQIFIIMNWVSLACSVADIAMEFVVNPVPLSGAEVALGMCISFAYKLLRNSGFVVYFVFITAITRTEYIIRPLRNRLILWFPNGVLTVALLQNFITHNVFSVTQEAGYSRGPLLIFLYVVSLLYGIAGMAYCIYCKRYLTTSKWAALLSVYILTFLAVGIELIKPYYLVEMFSTAIGILMIMLMVMRPEESMDAAVGLKSWQSYKTDIGNIVKAREHVQILVIQIANSEAIRSYLGEDGYNKILSDVAEDISAIYDKKTPHVNKEIYIERPGTFYYTIDDTSLDLEPGIAEFLDRSMTKLSTDVDISIQLEVRVCLIKCPDDIRETKDILNLGHIFTRFGELDRQVYYASEITGSHEYEILSHMDDILAGALREDRFEVYYQPIYNNRTKRFDTAEALLRLNDAKYGIISPAVFIPEAEANGMILPIGEVVLDKVFRFIAENDFSGLGLSRIDVNLSVAQVLQTDLPDTIEKLQNIYSIDPGKVNFEITETLFDNISDVMDKNVRTLKAMGYSFALDDYGIGYSNIQRMSKLPLSIIKIDKSLVDEMFSNDGQVILRNTVNMVKGINKELVAEGVETQAAIESLAEMACDYIQGFYYSRPLPEDEFRHFLLRNRHIA